MIDPAVGRSRAQRALGENHPKATKKKAVTQEKRSRLNEFRVVHVGQYDGPRASYGRYNVSEQAGDLLNRSKRNMDAR
jgi:uncharacterized membrane-anchored protein